MKSGLDAKPLFLQVDVLICQDKFCSEKQGISVIFGFFQDFLALFDTFTTRYSHSDINFEFFDQFQYIKHFISKKFLKMN